MINHSPALVVEHGVKRLQIFIILIQRVEYNTVWMILVVLFVTKKRTKFLFQDFKSLAFHNLSNK